MSAWWLLPLALAVCLAVVAVAACLSPKPRHAAPRRHLEAVPEPAPDPPYPLPWPRLEGDWLPAPPRGSMILDEERWERARQQVRRAQQASWLGELPAFQDAPDWREQTAADLAPEALDSDVQPDPYLDAIAAEHGSEWKPEDFQPGGPEGARDIGQSPAWLEEDSGPGDLSSLDPGPVLISTMGDWGQPNQITTYEPTRLADTGDIASAHLLAEAQAFMRAQDDDAALYLSRLRSACAQARLDLAAALT